MNGVKIPLANRHILYNMNLFDGQSQVLRTDACVMVEDDRILDVVHGLDAGMQAGFMPVDLQGRTLLPGLIDCHVHLTVPFMTKVSPRAFMDIAAQIKRNAATCIDAGITTVRDAGGFPRRLAELNTAIRNGDLKGPRIIRCNSAITTSRGCPDWVPRFNLVIKAFLGGQYAERVDSPEQASRAVQEMIAAGADWIKIYCQHRSWLLGGGDLPVFDRDTFRAIMNTSSAAGKKVCCHISRLDDLRLAMAMGVHTYEHSPLEAIPDETAISFAARDMVLNPTLTCLDLGNDALWETVEGICNERGATFLEPEPLRQVKAHISRYRKRPWPPPEREYRRQPYMNLPLIAGGYANAAANVVRILHAGGRVGVATDSGGLPTAFFGVFYAEELRRLVDLGLNNYQTLKAATSGNAEILGLQDKLGSIRPGRLADLIVVDGNPLDNLDAVSNVRMVMKGGRFLKGGPVHPRISSLNKPLPQGR